MLHWPKSVTHVTTKEKKKCITDYENIPWTHISNWKIETTEILVFPWDLNWSDATGEFCEEQCVWGREAGQHCHTWCAAGKSEGLPDYLLWLSGMTKKETQESWIYIWKMSQACISFEIPTVAFEALSQELSWTRHSGLKGITRGIPWMHTHVNSGHPPSPRALSPCHDRVN